MSKTEVTIITPAYNSSRFIRDCIDSVLGQSFQDWEMIIVNDASSDDTRLIVQEYQDKDPRIHCIDIPVNGGIANARNVGLIHAKGRYITFLDSDDCWLPHKLQQQINFIREKKAAFIFSSYRFMDAQGNLLNQFIRAPWQLTFKDLVRANYIGCLTVMLDSEKIDPIYFPKIRHEDFACWLSILQRGVTAYGMDEVLAEYRRSAQSVSSNKLKMVGWIFNIFYKHLGFGFIKSTAYTIRYSANMLLKYAKSREDKE